MTEDNHEEWLGTLSVLHPRTLQLMKDAFPRIPRIADAVAQDEIDRYSLVGMWVNPSARKMGIGGKINPDDAGHYQGQGGCNKQDGIP